MRIRFRDYPVQFRSEESIAKIALAWREAAGERDSAYFNVVDFFLNVLARLLPGRPVFVELFDAKERDHLAFVTYAPLTLHIDRETWKLAADGEPESRFIVAHEIGHLVLHQLDAKAFSPDASAQIRYLTDEESAEWQANTFAKHLLVPNHLARLVGSALVIARQCVVLRALAEERVAATRPRFSGNFCRCGGLVYGRGELCSSCANRT